MRVQRRRQIEPFADSDAASAGPHDAHWHDLVVDTGIGNEQAAADIATALRNEPPASDNDLRPAAPNRRQRRTDVPASRPVASRPNPIVWGVLGFALGVVFWHAIGFWSFVASVVLPHGPDRETSGYGRASDQRDAVPAQSRTVSHARPTRSLQQQQQVLTGRHAAATAPPRTAGPQPEMPLPGWGTTVVTAEPETGVAPATPGPALLVGKTN